MKTIRTRVTSAFRRNSKGTPAAPVPLKLRAASTSAPSILLPEKTDGTTAPPASPTTPTEEDLHAAGFRLEPELEPRSESPIDDHPTEKPNDFDHEFDLTGLTFTGDEPEEVYISPQSITITDDSKRSTPKRRIKIQTELPPPSKDPIEGDIKFVSPVDPNYLIDDAQASEPSLFDQSAPTDPSFIELTPKEVTTSLPPLHEVLAHQAHLKRLDSSIEVARVASFHNNIEEDKPLLEPSLLSAEVDDILDSVWPLPAPTFPSLGWTEHVLPSSSYYYSHAETRTVTDIDLRDEKKLAAVRSYLTPKLSPIANKANGPDANPVRRLRNDSMARIEQGVDLWLRDANRGLPTKPKSEWEFMPMRNWVLHATRAVTFDPPSERDGYQAPEELSDEDRLDLENRYWHYMATHPAHASLPQTAYDEAVEAVTWCYTDRVLRTPQPLPISPPFSQKECVELLELLRSVSASSSPTSTSLVRTRLVAQILLRFTEWRQKYIARSTEDTSSNTPANRKTEMLEHAIPFRRTFLRFVKGIVCLGIPYIVGSRGLEEWSSRPTDEEDQGGSRPLRSDDTGLGSSQALVAALLLSASVTLLIVPELNETSRVATLISALCAAGSMVSFVINVYGRSHRHRTRAENPISSQTAILASLPLIMLAYSLCAFVTGVIAYSMANRVGNVGRYTGWIVVAVWIALVAILAASAALTKGI